MTGLRARIRAILLERERKEAAVREAIERLISRGPPTGPDEPDHRHSGLLRACREWARARQTCDQAAFQRVGCRSHDDRDALRCALRGADRSGAADYDDIDLRPQQIADQRGSTSSP